MATSEIGLAVVVDVGKQHAEAVVSVGIVDAQLLAYVGEGAVAVVVKEMVVLACQAAWTAHHIDSAIVARSVTYGFGSRNGRIVEIDSGVAVDEQVEAAVAIVVAKGGPGGPGSTVTPAFSATSVNVPSWLLR